MYFNREEIENRCMLLWMETLINHDYTGAKAKAQWLLQQQEKEVGRSSYHVSGEIIYLLREFNRSF